MFSVAENKKICFLCHWFTCIQSTIAPKINIYTLSLRVVSTTQFFFEGGGEGKVHLTKCECKLRFWDRVRPVFKDITHV